MTFFTQFSNRPQYAGQAMDDSYIVEMGGYVDPKTQIEAFLLAGKRLVAGRAEAYDYPDGKDDGLPMDPTRSKNFDMADASQALNLYEEKVETTKRNLKKLQKEQEAAKAAEEKEAPEGEGK